jgi:hypothetical protein
MLPEAEYLIAWLAYVAAGIGLSAVAFKVTAGLSRLSRELLRGLVLILIFTPWYVADTTEFFAPATVVLLMDVLLEGSTGGLQGGVILLLATLVLLLVVTVPFVILRSTGRSSKS